MPRRHIAPPPDDMPHAGRRRGPIDRPGAPIRARFGGRFVFSDLDGKAFLRQAGADPGLDEIYRNRTTLSDCVLPAGNPSCNLSG